jgi:hypothetical protein
MKKIIGLVSVCLLAIGVAQAAVITDTVTSTSQNWTLATTWGAGVPGATDTNTYSIVINSGRSLYLNSDADAIYNYSNLLRMQVGNQTPGSAESSFTIGENGKLTLTSYFNIGANGSAGYLTLTNGANVSAASMTMGGTAADSAASTLKFVLGAAGFTDALDFTGAFLIRNTIVDQNLVIDLTDFSGAGTFDLVTFGSISGSFATYSISYVGLDAGQTASISYDSDSVILTVIPEPATIGLMGLGAVATFMLRRSIRRS